MLAATIGSAVTDYGSWSVHAKPAASKKQSKVLTFQPIPATLSPNAYQAPQPLYEVGQSIMVLPTVWLGEARKATITWAHYREVKRGRLFGGMTDNRAYDWSDWIYAVYWDGGGMICSEGELERDAKAYKKWVEKQTRGVLTVVEARQDTPQGPNTAA